MHPYAPFITEEIWSYFRGEDDVDLIVAPWLNIETYTPDLEAIKSFDTLKGIISSVRMIRSQMNIPPNKHSSIVIRKAEKLHSVINNSKAIIQSLAKVDKIIFSDDNNRPDKSATVLSLIHI